MGAGGLILHPNSTVDVGKAMDAPYVEGASGMTGGPWMRRDGDEMQDLSEEQPMQRASSEIDDNLKRVYQAMVDQEVPNRFEQLIEQLRQQERGA